MGTKAFGSENAALPFTVAVTVHGSELSLVTCTVCTATSRSVSMQVSHPFTAFLAPSPDSGPAGCQSELNLDTVSRFKGKTKGSDCIGR